MYILLSDFEELGLLLFGNITCKYTERSIKHCINEYFYQLWKKKVFLYPMDGLLSDFQELLLFGNITCNILRGQLKTVQ